MRLPNMDSAQSNSQEDIKFNIRQVAQYFKQKQKVVFTIKGLTTYLCRRNCPELRRIARRIFALNNNKFYLV